MKGFFDILQDILLKNSGGDLYEDTEFNKFMSNFMLVRYLSMRNTLMPYAQILNKFQCTMSSKDMYIWAYKNIPKQNSAWIKYISKKKTKVSISRTRKNTN